MYRRFGKRFFDLTLTVPALFVFAPLLLFLTLIVRLRLGAPVFFQQERPGVRGEPFILMKFRTMTNARSTDGALLPDAERLTAFGRFLRSTSLDELPELINVMKGEMSLVGPRPLLIRYLPRYNAAQMRRHDVLPGITGWAQVNGRNALSWEDKFKHDVWYVDHVSISLDIRILWLTIKQVLKRDGVSAEGHATAPEFMGTDQ